MTVATLDAGERSRGRIVCRSKRLPVQILQSPQPAHLQNAVDGFSEFPVVCMPSNTKVRGARAQLPRVAAVC